MDAERGTTPKGFTAPHDAITTHTQITFAQLGVRDEIVRALAEDGIEHPFAIQELTLPLALAGDDLIGQARTGMGKTLRLRRAAAPAHHHRHRTRPLTGIPRALVVVPTRELCLQVSRRPLDAPPST